MDEKFSFFFHRHGAKDPSKRQRSIFFTRYFWTSSGSLSILFHLVIFVVHQPTDIETRSIYNEKFPSIRKIRSNKIYGSPCRHYHLARREILPGGFLEGRCIFSLALFLLFRGWLPLSHSRHSLASDCNLERPAAVPPGKLINSVSSLGFVSARLAMIFM